MSPEGKGMFQKRKQHGQRQMRDMVKQPQNGSRAEIIFWCIYRNETLQPRLHLGMNVLEQCHNFKLYSLSEDVAIK